MTSQEIETNGNTQIEEHEYNYAEINAAFDKQKAQYQFPTKTTLRFLSKDKQKSKNDQITQAEYDEWGNLTKKIDLDGTVTTREYYPAEGEEGSCPPSPNPLGITSFVKSEVTSPPPSSYHSPIVKKEYTYTKMDVSQAAHNDDNHPLNYAVMPEAVTTFSDGLKLNSTLKKYINSKEDIDHGRVESIKESVFSYQNAPGLSDTIDDEVNCYESITSHTYSHNLTNRTMQETVTHVTHDGLQDQTASIRSTCEGHILEQTDALGVKTRYDYDKLSRRTKRTAAFGTDYERQTTYSYGIETIGNSPEKTRFAIATSGNGLMAKTWYDGLNRTIQQAKSIKDTKVSSEDIDWRIWSQQSFDPLGRLNKITTKDSIPSESTDDEPFLVENTGLLYYDEWGQHFKTQFTNGSIHQKEKHPISLQIVEKINGDAQGQHISTYDTSGLLKDVVIQTNDKTEAYKKEYTYDGLRRLRSSTDEKGEITSYEYDDRHRVTLIVFPDGTKLERSYAPFTEQPLVTQISVNGEVIGSREYDGRFRVIREEVGGRVTTNQYEGANPLPSSVIEPSGQIIKYTYIPELSNVIQTISVGDATQSFEYDPKTGLMLSAKQSNDLGSFDLSMTYDVWGRLTSETFLTPWATRSTAYTYSEEGLLLSYTDAGGETTKFSYDNYGRINRTSDAQTNVEITYDELNRIQSWTVNSPSESIQTNLTFDEFSREIQRDIIMSDGQATRLRQYYDCFGLIEKKTTSSFTQGDDAETILKTEIYTYDNIHRLSKYVSDGDLKTQDEYGNDILNQEYTYDAFGNILTVTTEFSDNEDKNVTTYYYKNENDPCQLTNISYTHPDYPAAVDLTYDANGRLISDHKGRTLSYDPLGRLQSVDDSQKTPAIAFSYDAHNQLRLLTAGPDADTRERYYLHNLLVTEIPSKESTDGLMRWMYAPEGIPVAQRNGSSDISLFATDVNHSVLFSSKREDGSYDPFGNRNLDANQVLLQYNGEARDGVTDYYHLGNGYRAYSPILRRFTSPDSWSPFGRGGINPYIYVHNDPINFTDPSGHVPVSKWLILGLDVALLGLGILSGVGAVAAVEASALTIAKGVILAGVTVVSAGTGIATEGISIAAYNTDTSKSDDYQKIAVEATGVAFAALTLAGKENVGKGVQSIRDRILPPSYEEAMEEEAATLNSPSATRRRPGAGAAGRAQEIDSKDLKNLRGGCLPQEAYMGRVAPGRNVNIIEGETSGLSSQSRSPQKVPSNPEHDTHYAQPAVDVPPPPEATTSALVHPEPPPPPVPPHSKKVTFSDELSQAVSRRERRLN